MDRVAKIVNTLKSYKNLSSYPDNHLELLKEKTVLLYTAALLESPDTEIVHLCLDILEDFIRNDNTHSTIIGTFGVFEALEWITINQRDANPQISERANRLVAVLRFSAPPAYSTRRHAEKNKPNSKGSYVYHFHVENLSSQNIHLLENTLVQIKGVISFITDLQRQKCTIRIGNTTTLHAVFGRLFTTCGLRASLIRRHTGQGSEIDPEEMGSKEEFDPILADYYMSDEEASTKDKCVAHKEEVTGKNGGWFKSAVKFWQRSFYW